MSFFILNIISFEILQLSFLLINYHFFFISDELVCHVIFSSK